jgi:hypothetical protein
VKRSALTRRTPLLAKSPLPRSQPPRNTRQAAKPKRRPQGVPTSVRSALAARSEGMCEIGTVGCTGRATDLAHRKKVGAGGRKGAAAKTHHVLSNALAACRSCHQNAHYAPGAAYWRGWHVLENQHPADVPVLRRQQWVLLDDQGGITPTSSHPEVLS